MVLHYAFTFIPKSAHLCKMSPPPRLLLYMIANILVYIKWKLLTVHPCFFQCPNLMSTFPLSNVICLGILLWRSIFILWRVPIIGDTFIYIYTYRHMKSSCIHITKNMKRTSPDLWWLNTFGEAFVTPLKIWCCMSFQVQLWCLKAYVLPTAR